MTASDRDRRHRWAEVCLRYADRTVLPDEEDDATDLRELAAYLRAPETESAKEEG